MIVDIDEEWRIAGLLVLKQLILLREKARQALLAQLKKERETQHGNGKSERG